MKPIMLIIEDDGDIESEHERQFSRGTFGGLLFRVKLKIILLTD